MNGAQVLADTSSVNGHAGLSRLFMLGAEHDDAIAAFRALAPLPPESQRVIDETVTEVGDIGLSVVTALMEAGLTKPVPEWMGILSLDKMRSGRTGNAQVSIHPDARGERQMPARTLEGFPLVLTWDDFSFPIRLLAQSRRMKMPLDTSELLQAGLNVNEKLEDVALHGIDFTVHGGGTLYGIENHPSNTTVPITKAWDDPTKTGAEYLADVRAMVAAQNANYNRGPFDLFVPNAAGLAITDDYKANGDKTILQRIEETPAGGRTIKVRVADLATVPSLVQMTRTRIELAIGTEPTPLSWGSLNGWHEFGMVLACMIVRIFTDSAGNTGIVNAEL